MSTAMVNNAEPPVNAGRSSEIAEYTVSRYVLEQLKAWGVKRVYGVIGDANLSLLDELGKQNAIRYIPCRHEGSAGLMASAEAKLTGRTAVCLATSGPGLANMLNGMADAAMDRSPVLALSGQVDTPRIGTHSKQYVDQQKLSAAVAGRSELVAHPDALPELMGQALVQGLVQGKVTHLAIPKDLYAAKVKGQVKPYGDHLHQPLAAPEQEIAELARLLEAAERPLLLIGRGARQVGASVRGLAENLSAAVVTTLPARPQFPNDHELYAGGLGQAGSESASMLLAESDLILMLGATWWPEDYVPVKARIVQIDINREAIGMGHSLYKGVVGDLGQIIPRLARLIQADVRNRDVWKARIREVCDSWKLRIEEEAGEDGSPVPPQRLMKIIAEQASEDAILAVDTGEHTLWFNRIFQAKPMQDILVSGRWRTLGFALPAAIAAKLTHPDRQVIAIAGDGGVIQTLMEFQTAVEQRLPIVLVVMNNGAYAMEKHRMDISGMNTTGSAILNPDFAKISEACGGMGYRAASGAEFESCLRQALSGGKPALIEVSTACIPVPHTKI
ncbi:MULTISPECIES: thiamine pyrophosphate-binding protein [unclassified Paenibacillus]|uniref:thiamine pyrophosphate-binding protein n=1 Tax=unclassified Paenibacillus TaxID=185978 RepID=UPI001AE90B33|nr:MULTISPECIES: thiamine pyrophosphate-binding protein [unclassified Paenibacillus]MBP1154741.1 pyruvate dehydrogenase (quinone)/pyruvate oxidase [Paenibacillus sp. PvP091]MBP1169875.1 pyruvate dehydrogenase (quinone)/pyruvate oxidase [Paenibacillus sp. PvR098]MBP2440903.1 pyruvate dehydrogenase (quinone)/pyruvate oxidase [Paenibacillus sp. PvP052]